MKKLASLLTINGLVPTYGENTFRSEAMQHEVTFAIIDYLWRCKEI